VRPAKFRIRFSSVSIVIKLINFKKFHSYTPYQKLIARTRAVLYSR
jgi:hypothetical protein